MKDDIDQIEAEILRRVCNTNQNVILDQFQESLVFNPSQRNASNLRIQDLNSTSHLEQPKGGNMFTVSSRSNTAIARKAQDAWT